MTFTTHSGKSRLLQVLLNWIWSQFIPDKNGKINVNDVTEILSQIETTPVITPLELEAKGARHFEYFIFCILIRLQFIIIIYGEKYYFKTMKSATNLRK